MMNEVFERLGHASVVDGNRMGQRFGPSPAGPITIVLNGTIFQIAHVSVPLRQYYAFRDPFCHFGVECLVMDA